MSLKLFDLNGALRCKLDSKNVDLKSLIWSRIGIDLGLVHMVITYRPISIPEEICGLIQLCLVHPLLYCKVVNSVECVAMVEVCFVLMLQYQC